MLLLKSYFVIKHKKMYTYSHVIIYFTQNLNDVHAPSLYYLQYIQKLHAKKMKHSIKLK